MAPAKKRAGAEAQQQPAAKKRKGAEQSKPTAWIWEPIVELPGQTAATETPTFWDSEQQRHYHPRRSRSLSNA